MFERIKKILSNNRGSAASSIFTVFFVMIVLMLTVAIVLFVTSYITYNRLITEVEQNLNDAAAKAEKTYLYLTETDKGNYSIDDSTLSEMETIFKDEFMKNLTLENEQWTISQLQLHLYQSSDDNFAILHRLTCHIKMKIPLFNNEVGIIEKDIALNGEHQFAEIFADKSIASDSENDSDTGGITSAAPGGDSELSHFVDGTRPS